MVAVGQVGQEVDVVGHHVSTVIIATTSAQAEYVTMARVAGMCEHCVCAAFVVVSSLSAVISLDIHHFSQLADGEMTPAATSF